MKKGETENKMKRAGSSWEHTCCCCIFGFGASGADTLKSCTPLPHSLRYQPPLSPQHLPDRDKVLSIWSTTSDTMDWGRFVRNAYVILSSVWHFRLFVSSVMMQSKNKTPTTNDVKWCERGRWQDKGWRRSLISVSYVHSKTMSATRDSNGSSGQRGEEQEYKDWRSSCELITEKRGGLGTHLFG